MSSLAISVENVSKVYRLGEIDRSQFIHDIRRWVKGRFNPDHTFGDPETEAEQEPQALDLFYALKNVSFDIKQGETVGIIGANGAGKSTLLKLISRITSPSKGSIKINGRVGSLLEVGTGFHPDLTGRDNVYMNGAILGMSRSEVAAKFDDIISFSGVEKFIDTPVKRYSSGMFIRLAFSVAAFLEPEILIVDEVLSVGDLQFQNRCLSHLKSLIKDGKTVLFVSHGAGQIRSLCTRAICLKNGEIICDDKPNTALDYYQIAVRESAGAGNRQHKDKDENDAKSEFIYQQETKTPQQVATIVYYKILNQHGNLTASVLTSQSFTVLVAFEVFAEGYFLRPSCTVTDELGNHLFWTADCASRHHEEPTTIGRHETQFTVPGRFLSPGKLSFNIELGDARNLQQTYACTNPPAYVLVEDDLDDEVIRGIYKGPIAGFIRPKMTWETK
jgi:lipopolysaccharide transport system ATP-binding protein